MKILYDYDPGKPVVIRTYPDEYEGELARSVLEGADIPSMLVREYFEGRITHVGVAVRTDCVEEAIAILDAPPGDSDDNDDGTDGPTVD
jgi:hypothetical protein